MLLSGFFKIQGQCQNPRSSRGPHRCPISRGHGWFLPLWSSGTMFHVGLVPVPTPLPPGLLWPVFWPPGHCLQIYLPHVLFLVSLPGFSHLGQECGVACCGLAAGSFSYPALAHPGGCSVTKTSSEDWLPFSWSELT